MRRFKLGNSLAGFFTFNSIAKLQSVNNSDSLCSASAFGKYSNEAQEVFNLALRDFKEGQFSKARSSAEEALEKLGQIKILDPVVLRLEMEIERMLEEIDKMSSNYTK